MNLLSLVRSFVSRETKDGASYGVRESREILIGTFLMNPLFYHVRISVRRIDKAVFRLYRNRIERQR